VTRTNGLTSRQGQLLGYLLAGETVEHIQVERGLSKQYLFQLMNALRKKGLVVTGRRNGPCKLVEASPAECALVYWVSGGETWQVLRVSLPHLISNGRLRRDLESDQALMVFVRPGGAATTAVFPARQRVPYPAVEDALRGRSTGLVLDPRVIQRATEAVGMLLGQEAVLPAWFLEEPTGGGSG
jgi:hypothetical protein